MVERNQKEQMKNETSNVKGTLAVAVQRVVRRLWNDADALWLMAFVMMTVAMLLQMTTAFVWMHAYYRQTLLYQQQLQSQQAQPDPCPANRLLLSLARLFQPNQETNRR